jgi:hypothetical protein
MEKAYAKANYRVLPLKNFLQNQAITRMKSQFRSKGRAARIKCRIGNNQNKVNKVISPNFILQFNEK